MIKLALTDLDNTLIPQGAPHASMRAIAGIHAMLCAGLHFGPVSGRVPAAMRWMFGGDAACSKTGAFVNGQLVYVNGRLVHQSLLPSADLAQVGAWVRGREGCALAVYDLDDLSRSTDGAVYYLGATAEELARHEACFGRHPRIVERLAEPAYAKANLRCDLARPELAALRDELRADFPMFDFVLPTRNGPFVDILPRGWGKGRAVELIARHLRLSLDEVVVFGDSENDVSMLETVTHAVAVRNASPEALAAARYRIGLAVDDAVAEALFELVRAARTGTTPSFLRPAYAST